MTNSIKRTMVAALLHDTDYDRQVNVKGWVRSHRGSGKIAFIALNDGSTINSIQVVVDVNTFDKEMLKKIGRASCRERV